MVKKPINIWHERLGHINERYLKAMAKNNLVYDLTFEDTEKMSKCQIFISQNKHVNYSIKATEIVQKICLRQYTYEATMIWPEKIFCHLYC